MKQNSIHHGDALDILRGMPDPKPKKPKMPNADADKSNGKAAVKGNGKANGKGNGKAAAAQVTNISESQIPFFFDLCPIVDIRGKSAIMKDNHEAS